MPGKNEIAVVTLFGQLEALRVLMKLPIEDVAYMMAVTPLAYKNWKNHETVPMAEREPDFKTIIKRLENRYKKKKSDS